MSLLGSSEVNRVFNTNMYAIFPNEYHHNDQPEQLSHILPKRMLNYTTNGPDRKEEASAKVSNRTKLYRHLARPSLNQTLKRVKPVRLQQ